MRAEVWTRSVTPEEVRRLAAPEDIEGLDDADIEALLDLLYGLAETALIEAERQHRGS